MIDNQEIHYLYYRELVPIHRLAAIFGVLPGDIRKYFKENNFKPVNTWSCIAPFASRERIIEEYVDNKKGAKTIAKSLSISVTAVKNTLINARVPIRNSLEQNKYMYSNTPINRVQHFLNEQKNITTALQNTTQKSPWFLVFPMFNLDVPVIHVMLTDRSDISFIMDSISVCEITFENNVITQKRKFITGCLEKEAKDIIARIDAFLRTTL